MKRVALMIGFVALLSGLLGGQATVAAPLPDPSWATWHFDASFVNGTIPASWTIEIGGEDANGDPVVLHRETQPIACQRVGQVTIGSNYADFNGGHVECLFPDFSQTVDDIIAKVWGPGFALDLSNTCECLPTQNLFVDVTAKPAAGGPNPVFYHPSFQFGLPTDGTTTANHLAVNQQSSTGPGRAVKSLTSFRSEHACFAGEPLCKFYHYQAQQDLGSDGQPYITTSLYTGKTTIYLGYDPQTGARFRGRATTFAADPGCRMD